MSRVYIHASADEFLFASEAKALLKVRRSLREIRLEQLAEYFRYNCVLGNKTLYREITLLPKASAWSFCGASKPKQRQYFDYAEWEQQPRLEPEPFYARWAETVASRFPRYARGGKEVGLSATAPGTGYTIGHGDSQRAKQKPSKLHIWRRMGGVARYRSWTKSRRRLWPDASGDLRDGSVFEQLR